MSEKVTDEMLMAYADGELDTPEREKIALLAQADPALAARIADFSRSRAAVAGLYAPVRAEPVPPELVAAAMGRKPAGRPAFRPWGMAAAAMLAVAAGLGGYWTGLDRPGAPGFFEAATGEAALAALAQAPSGEVVALGGTIEAMARGSYQTPEGPCRLYEARGADESLAGVACLGTEGWRVLAATRDSGPADYRPAAEAGIAALDSFLDGLGAGPDMGAEEEAALIARGWR